MCLGTWQGWFYFPSVISTSEGQGMKFWEPRRRKCLHSVYYFVFTFLNGSWPWFFFMNIKVSSCSHQVFMLFSHFTINQSLIKREMKKANIFKILIESVFPGH